MKKSFIFPGQGSQTVGMVKEFYDNFKVARETLEIVNDSLKKDLSKIMFEGPESDLTDTENAQPAIMAGSMVILNVLENETGKKINELCDFVAGHSLGEYSALCASEAINLNDTAKLLRVRGKAFSDIGKISKGSMVALVGATIEQAQEVVEKSRLDGEICQIANDNTVGQVVLSGNVNSIDKAVEVATSMNIKRAIKLSVSGAFHSKLMEPAITEMEKALNDVNINNPFVPVIANYTANISDKNNIKENLLKQITGTVRCRETMLFMEKEGCEMFIEIGNGKVLSNMVPRTCSNVKAFAINSIESMNNFIKEFI